MILYESFREELVEMIEDSEPAVFEGSGKTKEEILADKDLLDWMWGIFQKSISEYYLDAGEAFRCALEDTLEDTLEIPATT